MARRCLPRVVWLALLIPLGFGCASPYRSDQGALFGGLLGAGTGAAVGSALGHTGAGAAIGAGVGALSGAAVGGELDKMDAQNRALIEQRMGRPVSATPVTMDDVVNMTRSGVDEDLIATHVRTHGMIAPLQTADLIVLQQQGVSKRVIAAMQAPPPQPVAAAVYQGAPVYAAPAPVFVEPYYYAPYGPHYYHFHHRPPPPRPHPGVSWGVSVSH
jgi:surface antigen